MDYTKTEPCGDCPFTREGVRLSRERAKEIADLMLSSQGGDFPCHKTVCYDGSPEGRKTPDSVHCAGALMFAEKNNNQTQMMRICERLGMYDFRALIANTAGMARVFNTRSEMLKANNSRALAAFRRGK